MIYGAPGLDVSALVRAVLAEDGGLAPSFGQRLGPLLGQVPQGPFARLFGTKTGQVAVGMIGNESRTLDLLSSFSVEILLEAIGERWGFGAGQSRSDRRFLTVPGISQDPPTLLVLDPAVSDISQSRRLTDEIHPEPERLRAAFDRLRPVLRAAADNPLALFLSEADPGAALELLWILQPEVVLSRRPRMVPLSAPSPHIVVLGGGRVSTAGVFCHDAAGKLGVTACFHGTGPIGTPVNVGRIAGVVRDIDSVQDIVFIPLASGYAIPPLYGRAGVRTANAPSEAEPVVFDGAGSQAKVATRVKSHDAGILRRRRTVQLKVQTPADTNSGDSGSALIDANDRIVGFAFERTGVGEFPELTDWIWADNALSALGLVPL